jgi:hypothetical protein
MRVKNKKFPATTRAARNLIKQEISELSWSRALFVSEAKRKQDAAAPSMSDALTGAILKQAEQKNFNFEN